MPQTKPAGKSLPPRGAVRVVVHRHGAHLGIVVRQVHDDLGEPGLEPLHRVEIELLPPLLGNVLVGDDDGVRDDVLRRHHRLGS